MNEIPPDSHSTLERALTQWHVGDWDGLTALENEKLDIEYGGEELLHLLAAGFSQQGKVDKARYYSHLAGREEKTKIRLRKLLISGVHNSLGRSYAVIKNKKRAIMHFEESVNLGDERKSTSALNLARIIEQISQVEGVSDLWGGLFTSEDKKSLYDIYAGKKGKISDKWMFYLFAYDIVFNRVRDKRVSLFEIGVQNGGSLEAWSEYFHNAELIVGCDINKKCQELVFEDKKISVVVGNAADNEVRDKVKEKIDYFDIIIDDGSHVSGDCIKNFLQYFPLLSYGGFYVVEDVHCSYWGEFEGGLSHPVSTMTFFKKLSDVVNHEHWNNGVKIKSYFSDFFNSGVALEYLRFEEIFSISFMNSMIIVEKRSRQHCIIGERVVVGENGLITGDSHLKANGSKIKFRDQRNNPFSWNWG